MVRAIDSRLYDKSVKTLDFSEARVRTTAKNKRFVDKFLEANLQTKNTALILVNPFNITSAFSLSLQGCFEIMRQICNLRHSKNTTKLIPLVITYPKVHSDFICKFENGGGI